MKKKKPYLTVQKFLITAEENPKWKYQIFKYADNKIWRPFKNCFEIIKEDSVGILK